jgi:hypothetical protein
MEAAARLDDRLAEDNAKGRIADPARRGLIEPVPPESNIEIGKLGK